MNNIYDDYEKLRNQLELELNLNKKVQKCSNNNQTTKCFCQNFQQNEQKSTESFQPKKRPLEKARIKLITKLL